jgi:Na+/citrate or Na+/malate symporter
LIGIIIFVALTKLFSNKDFLHMNQTSSKAGSLTAELFNQYPIEHSPTNACTVTASDTGAANVLSRKETN